MVRSLFVKLQHLISGSIEMKCLKEAHMPLRFCLEFIIIAVWERLVGGVKVFF